MHSRKTMAGWKVYYEQGKKIVLTSVDTQNLIKVFSWRKTRLHNKTAIFNVTWNGRTPTILFIFLLLLLFSILLIVLTTVRLSLVGHLFSIIRVILDEQWGGGNTPIQTHDIWFNNSPPPTPDNFDIRHQKSLLSTKPSRDVRVIVSRLPDMAHTAALFPLHWDVLRLISSSWLSSSSMADHPHGRHTPPLADCIWSNSCRADHKCNPVTHRHRHQSVPCIKAADAEDTFSFLNRVNVISPFLGRARVGISFTISMCSLAVT